jgi:hypothetical protein
MASGRRVPRAVVVCSIGLLAVMEAGCGSSPDASGGLSQPATATVTVPTPDTTVPSTTTSSVDASLPTAAAGPDIDDGPPQVDLGTFADQDSLLRALQTIGATSALDNEDVAAVAEGRAPAESICADIMSNNEPGAGTIIHQVSATLNGDGGVVFVLRHPDESLTVRMYSTGDADPVTGGCRLLFDAPFAVTQDDPAFFVAEWQQQLTDLLASTRVVIADHPGALAVDTGGGDWLLMNTHTLETVTAAGVGTVIGVGNIGEDFLIVTNVDGSLTTVNIQAVRSDGSVKLLGSLETPDSTGGAPPPRAQVVSVGIDTFVLVQTATSTAFSVGTPAQLFHGKVFPMATTIYGELTMTDDGRFIVTREPFSGSRQISADHGQSWSDANIAVDGFGATMNLTSIDADTAIVYDGTDRGRLAVAHSDGSFTEIGRPPDGGGWFMVPAADRQQGLVIGRLSGQAITVDRSTGMPVSNMRQLFVTDGDQVMIAWLAPDGHYKALVAHGSLCQPDGRNYFGDCESIRIIDGLESP